MKPTSKLSNFLALAGTTLLAISYTHADQIWDGGSLVDSNWNTATNWGLDGLPTFTNAITFVGNTRNDAVNNLTPDSIIGGINLTNDGTVGKTNAFTLSNARITLGGNIVTTASSSAITDTISLAMILDGNRTITTNANHNLSISGIISETGGARTLTKDGTGILTLSVTNTYTGGTTLNAGTIRAGATVAGSIFGTQTLTFANTAGALLDLNGFNVNVRALAGGGTTGGNIALGSNTLNLTDGANTTYSGIISGTGNVTVNGSSGQTIAGANTYTGTTTIGSGNITYVATNLANGGVASSIGQSTSAAGNLVFNGGGGADFGPTLRYDSSSTASTDRRFTLSGTGNITGALGVGSTGAVNWTSTAAVSYVGTGTRIVGFTGDGAGLGTFAGSIGDNGANATSIFKRGASTWSLTNTGSNFTGSIVMSAHGNGRLNYASAGGANAITFNTTTGTAILSYTGSGQTMSGAITASALTTGTITLDASGAGAVNYSNTGSLGSAGSGIKNLILSGTNTGINILAGQWVNNTGAAATLTKNGAGTWSLTNSLNSYTGGTTVSAGTLRFVSGALGTSGAINATGGTLQWATGNTSDLSLRLATTAAGITTLDTNGNNVTFANALGTANTGLLVKTGSGTLTLQATNNYTGTTTVNAGTLALDYATVASKLADGAALILGGGTLDMRNGASSHTEIVSATTLTALTGSYVTQSSGTSVLQMNTITPNTGTVNFGAGNIATTDNLNSATTGIIGTWATVGGDWAINSGSTTSGGATVAGVGVADGFIRAYTAYTDVTRLDSGTKAISNGTTTNVRIIDGTGGTGDNTVTGTIAINTLNQSATGGAATISMANQTLRTDGILMGPTAGALTIGAAGGTAALSGTLTSTAATGSIIVTNNHASNLLTINSVIANNTTTSLVKNGTGVLVLTGANTYTGGTVIQDGTIRAGSSASIFGTATLTLANLSTAALDLNGFDASVGSLAGGGALGGNVILGNRTLTIQNAGTTYGGVISGTGGNLIKNSNNAWTTTGAHTYTGITRVNGSAITTNILADGGVASGIGQSTNAAANLIFGGGGVNYSGTADASTDRQFTLAGNGALGVTSTGAITWSNTAAITHSGAGTRILYLGGNGAGLGTVAASIGNNTDGSAVSVIKWQNSNWNLTNTGSTFTGAIEFSAATGTGTIAYASAGGANPITFSQTTGSVTLSYTGSGQTMSGLIQANALSTGTITLDASGTGAVNYSNTGSLGVGGASGAKGLVLSGTNTGNNILAGGWSNNTLGGAATLTKNGTGTWTITNNHGYTGATNVNAGTLAVNGSITSAVIVASGATLQGSGTITGTVLISGGGAFAAGNSIESLASGNLTLAAAAIFAYEMNNEAAAGVAGDLADVAGNFNLDLGNASILTLTELGAGSWTAGEKLTLISYTGSWNGGRFNYGGSTLLDDSTISFSGATWTFNYNDTGAGTNYVGDTTGAAGFVTMTVIPEPSAALLGGLGLLALLRRRR